MEISTQKIGYQKYNNGVMDIKKYFKYRVPKYNQVFMSKFKFTHNLSILDLLFNLGPKSLNYLSNLNSINSIKTNYWIMVREVFFYHLEVIDFKFFI